MAELLSYEYYFFPFTTTTKYASHKLNASKISRATIPTRDNVNMTLAITPLNGQNNFNVTLNDPSVKYTSNTLIYQPRGKIRTNSCKSKPN